MVCSSILTLEGKAWEPELERSLSQSYVRPYRTNAHTDVYIHTYPNREREKFIVVRRNSLSASPATTAYLSFFLCFKCPYFPHSSKYLWTVRVYVCSTHYLSSALSRLEQVRKPLPQGEKGRSYAEPFSVLIEDKSAREIKASIERCATFFFPLILSVISLFS